MTETERIAKELEKEFPWIPTGPALHLLTKHVQRLIIKAKMEELMPMTNKEIFARLVELKKELE